MFPMFTRFKGTDKGTLSALCKGSCLSLSWSQLVMTIRLAARNEAARQHQHNGLVHSESHDARSLPYLRQHMAALRACFGFDARDGPSRVRTWPPLESFGRLRASRLPPSPSPPGPYGGLRRTGGVRHTRRGHGARPSAGTGTSGRPHRPDAQAPVQPASTAAGLRDTPKKALEPSGFRCMRGKVRPIQL